MNISNVFVRSRFVMERGFSIIELMIAMTLGLMVIAGVTTIFVNNMQARDEIERSSRQIENGRYATSLLSEDLRMAGFLSSFDPYELIIRPSAPPLGGAAPMAAMPDPCNATLTGNSSSWINSFFFHVQGYDNASAIPACLADVKAGSDILVIRRVSACVAGPTVGAGCDAAVAGAPYFQASNCYQNGELATNTGATSSTDYLAHFALSTDTSTAGLGKRAIDCTAIADYRRYLVRIYFVANNNLAGDGIPTLKRAELGAGGFAIVPMVEGIETIQFEYGIDTTGDGLVDTFNADPNTYSGCVGAACIQYWLKTYAVKVNVLARNTQASPGYSSTKTFVLGKQANGSDNTFGPYTDSIKRHAFTSSVRLDNPAGRKLP